MPFVRRMSGLATAIVVTLAMPTLAHGQEDAAAFVGSWEGMFENDAVVLDFREGGQATGTQGGDTYQLRWSVGGADMLDGVAYTILEMEIIGGPKMYTRALFEGADTLILSEPEAALEQNYSDPITLRRVE
ncbi:MAG: hypothetical protein AAFX92_02160 [Pseudomonadota bacterium]